MSTVYLQKRMIRTQSSVQVSIQPMVEISKLMLRTAYPVIVETKNEATDRAQNYGVYALGQYGTEGSIKLSGKNFD